MRILPVWSYLPTIRGLMENWILGERRYPFYASFKLTSRCHFGCPYCNVKKDQATDLSTGDIIKILDNLSRSSILMTSFEGGEPLLRNDIGELLRYARSYKFYLLFTTSVRNPQDYPLEEYARYIDFLHVSIDEGHGNLELFDRLPALARLRTQLAVQVVVTQQTVDALEDKVRRCWEAGAKVVIIPAAVMDKAEDHFPDMDKLEHRVIDLKKKFPDTIHTPTGFFAAYRQKKCSPASLIIAPDGRLYYPCHIMGTKGPDLRSTDLNLWLRTPEAGLMRASMKQCDRNCGWYQYYSIDSYTSIATVWEAIGPMLGKASKRRNVKMSKCRNVEM